MPNKAKITFMEHRQYSFKKKLYIKKERQTPYLSHVHQRHAGVIAAQYQFYCNQQLNATVLTEKRRKTYN
jgi:hypothetical protein